GHRNVLRRGLEVRRGDTDFVIAHWHRRERKLAVTVRLRRLRPIRSNRLQLYRGSGHWPVLRVVHHTLYFSENCGAQPRATKQKHRETQAENEPTHKASVLNFYFFSACGRS